MLGICKEPLIGTLGILFAGIITIPFAASMSGAIISPLEALKMSVIFAVGRFVWLLSIRLYFSRHE
jgi:hypothetical protein